MTGGGAGVGFAVARAFARGGACRHRRTEAGAADACRGADRGAKRGRRSWPSLRTGEPRHASGSSPRRSSGSGRRHSGQQRRPLRARAPDRRGRGGGDRFLATNVPARSIARAPSRKGPSSKGGAGRSSTSAASPARGRRPAAGSIRHRRRRSTASPVRWRSNGRPKGLRVNAVAPGHVATEGVIEDFRAGRLDEAAMIRIIPAGRIADVDDIADAVLFLCSDRLATSWGRC